MSREIKEVLRFVEYGSLNPPNFTLEYAGYNDDELREFFQERYSLLPKKYVEYLKLLGKRNPALNVFNSTNLHSIQLGISQLLANCEYFVHECPFFPDNCVVFQHFQCIEFKFFFLGDDDPFVFYYSEDGGVIDTATRFSEHIYFEMERISKSIKNLYGNK